MVRLLVLGLPQDGASSRTCQYTGVIGDIQFETWTFSVNPCQQTLSNLICYLLTTLNLPPLLQPLPHWTIHNLAGFQGREQARGLASCIFASICQG